MFPPVSPQLEGLGGHQLQRVGRPVQVDDVELHGRVGLTRLDTNTMGDRTSADNRKPLRFQLKSNDFKTVAAATEQ